MNIMYITNTLMDSDSIKILLPWFTILCCGLSIISLFSFIIIEIGGTISPLDGRI